MLIIIIGLPGSGKTTLASSKYKDYKLFDDFIFNFYNGEVISAIQSGDNVCLTDPRLCLPDIFNRYIETLQQYINKQNIKLIVFKNNPEQCKLNKPCRTPTINKYTKFYNIDTYKDFDVEEINVPY